MNNFTGTLDLTPNTTVTSTVLNAKGNTALSNWAYRLLFLCLAFALTTGVAKAQLVANYSFNATSGTYTPISGGTVSHASGWDDVQVNSVPIGFPFWFNGKVYDIISINPNGSIIFQNGTGTTSPSYTPISGTGTYFGAVGAWARDLQAQNTAPLGEIQYLSSGGVFTVQWSNARRYNTTTTNAERINFQIKLYEATGVVEIVYGDWSNAISATSTSVGQVGLRGLNNSDYNNLSVLATDNWSTPLAGASNAATVYYNEATPAVKPAEGLTYTYTPIAPVGVPTGLNFTSVQALQLTVNWTDNSTEEIGYIVQYSSDGGNNWTTGTVTAADATTATITGLSASTNYDWRVAAIREVPGAFVTGTQATGLPGNNTSVQSGNWSDPNTWSLGTVPTSSDNVTVGSGHEVVMDINGNAYSITVTGGGVLRSEELPSPTARTVTVLNDVVINASSTLRSAALSPLAVVNNTLSIGGNMTINGDGTFNGSASGNGKLNLVFTGATNNSFTSSATATINLNTLTINKGAGPINILEFSPGAAFTSPAAGFATLTNGILKLGGTATWSNPVIALATPTISANGGIWLDNPNATVTAKNASSSISGYFRVTQGTYNIGTLASALIGGATTTNMIIEGGTLNVSGRLYFTTGTGTSFNMSGGVINVQTAGNNTASSSGSFGMSSTLASFTMSGGVINIVHPSTGTTPYDTYINVTTPNITGGLINIGVPGTTPPSTVFNGVRQKVPSLHIGDGFTATSGAALTVLGNLSVGTGATYNFNNTASTNFFLVINGNSSAPGNIINNGLITHNLANTQAIRMQMFGQHGVQTVSGSGSIGAPAGPIFGMGISNPAGVNFTSANALYTNRINLFEGDVTGANNITLGNSTSTVIQISLDNSTVMGGSLDAAPTFNSSGHTILYLDEPNPRTTGFEIPSSRIVSNISITNDNSDLTLAGGNVTTTSLGLNAGNITTDGSNVLIVTGAINGGSADSYVNGPLVRGLAANLTGTTTVNFPIGKSGYNPLDLVNPVTGAGTVGVLAEVFDANSGGTPGNLLNQLNTTRYWNVDIVDGAANFTGTHIRLNDTRGIFDQIASSATVNGTYELVGGLDPVLDPESITSSNPAISALAGYYLMAQAEASEITNILANPAGNECVNVQRTITATVTPGAGTVTGVVINYSVNSVPQTPITMTNTGGNNWEGIIPTVTPANATVVWSITATESTNLTATTADVTYQDEPIFDFNAEIVSNLNNQCAGTEIELVLNAPSEVNIGTGSTTSTTYSSPFYSLWSNKHQQIMYLASELTAAGMKPGAIKAITFYVNSGTMPNKDFSLKMAHTTATDMSAFVEPSFVTVYSVPTYQQVVGPNTLEFDTPFNWNGTDNIVIEICFGDAGSSATLSSTAQMDNTSFVSSIKANPSAATAANVSCSNTTTNLVTYSVRPRTTFTTAGLEAYTISWSDGTNTVGTSDTIVVVPTTTTSYTATVTDVNGCTKTFGPTEITVLPLPAAPGSAVGSTQCGEGVPEAFATGGLPGTYLWYLDPTGGTALPGENNQALQNYSISTTTTFYVALTDGNCISIRVPVTATVNQPDPIAAVLADDEICLGEQADLSINQTGSNQTYTYTWTATPEAGSGITNGTQGAPLSFTPTAAGTYEYSVVAVDGPCTISTSTILTVVSLPPITSATATPSTICFGESATLAGYSVDGALGQDTVGIPTTTLGGVNGNPYRSGNGAGNQLKTQLLYTAAEMQAAGYTTGNITGLGFITTTVGGTMVDMTIKIGATNVSNLTSTFETTPLTEVFTTPTFTAVANSVNFHPFSTPFYWDGSSNILVEVCQTNSITGTTTVRAYAPGFTSNVQAHTSTTSCSNASGSEVANKPVIVFEGIVGTNVTDTYIWEWNPGAIAGDTIVVNPSSTEDYTVTVTNPNTGCSNSFGPVTVTVNQLPEPPIGLDSEHCGLVVPDASVSTGGANGSGVFNWYDAPTGGNLLQSGTDATYLTAIDVSTTFYVSETGANGCESERTPVNVTVIEADPLTLTATATTPCIGSNVTLEVTQGGGNNTYTFTYSADPLAGSGITGSETGTSVIVVPTAAGTYIYSVTGEDVDKGCLAGATVEFTVNEPPVITTASATPTTVCSGEQVNLVAASVPSEPLDVTFGLGAATSNSSGSPFYALYGGGKISYIYTAAELQAQGVVAGPINSMSIEVTVAGTVTYKEFTIGIGHTGATQFATAAHVTDPITNVFTGPLTDNGYLPTLGINTFNFSSPFVWDGTSNIVVTYCWSNADAGSTTASGFTVKRDTYTGQYLTAYTYADNRTVAQVCSTVSGGVSDGSTTTGGTSRLTTRTQTIFNAEVGEDITDDFTWEWNPGAIAGSEVSINPTSTETYTVTATDEDGCTSVSDPVEVTVLDLPPTPTATPSTQCGIGVPTASVTDNGGTLLWYDAASGGNLLQTGGNTYTTAIDVTTTFYVSETDGTCESERAAVTVTVIQPDPVTASVSDISICPAESITLEATQTGSNQTYVYTWTATPEAGSGLVNGTQGASININPTAAGTYEYTVTAFDSDESCTVITSAYATVNPNPVITTVTAIEETICSGGQSVLSATIMDIGPGTTTVGTQTTTLSTTGSPYRAGAGSNSQIKTQLLVTAAELTAAGLYPGNINSLGFTTTTSTGTFVNFEIRIGHTAATSLTTTFLTDPMTTVFTLPSYSPVPNSLNLHVFDTPFAWDGVSNIIVEVRQINSVTGTSTVAAFSPGFTANLYSSGTTGHAATTGATTANRPIMTFGGQVFSDQTGAYNFTWNPGNLSGSSVFVTPTTTTTYNVVATNPFTLCFSEPEEITVTVAPVGANASASTTTSCAGSSVLLNANPTGGAPFTFSWSDGTNVVGTTEELTVSPTATTTYTVTVTDACNNSTNSQVTITVNDLPVVSINETSPVSVCDPATPTLTATSSVPNVTYEWYQDGSPIPGSNAASYVATQSASYTVRTTDNNTGCLGTMSAAVVVEINPLPSALSINPSSPVAACEGTPVLLTANGGTIGGTGSGVITGTSPTTTTGAQSPFYRLFEGSRKQYLLRAAELQAMGMSAGSSLTSLSFNVTTQSRTTDLNLDNFNIKVANTSLTSLATGYAPEALTMVYSTASYEPVVGTNLFNFSSPFAWDGTSSIVVEVCFDNDPDNTCSAGSPVCWSNAATVSVATSLAGSSRYNSADNTTGVRDMCTGAFGTQTATTSRPIMDITFTTVVPTQVTWSPQAGLFTDAAGTVPYTGQPATSVYAMPSADATFTAVSTSTAGCSGDPVDVDVTVTPALTVSADIVGPTNATAHVGSLPVATYSIATTNETSITWDIPVGSTNVSGQGTNTISFNYPVGYSGGSISVTVEGNSPCEPITRTLTITYDCPQAPVVSGPTNVCPFVGTSTEVTYTVAPDPGVSSYNWVVPPNVTIVSGQGTGSLTVTFQTGFTTQANKQIRVTGQSGCGNTAMTIYYLLTQFPSAAGPITGPSDACAFIGTSNEATYSIDPVTAAESYLWTVPTGVTIVSGAGTSSINVTFDNSFTTSAITVRAVNGCGTSTPRSITVTRTAPSTPSLISGPTNACMLMPTSANPSGVPAVYTVANVPGNTYTWVVPSGATINSGQGTNSIEVSFDGTYSGGNINVFASTSCGNSGLRSLSLTQLTPSAPVAIDVLELGACPERMIQYSLASVPSNSTNLLWTVPAGATIMSGQGTTSITVSYPSTALAGNVTVTAQNGCGNSSTRTLKVKLSACEAPPPPPPFVKDGGVKEVPGLMLEVSVFPNPSTHVFNVQAKSTDMKTRVVLKVMDNLGRVMESHNMMPGETQPVGTRLKAGSYFIEVMQGNERVTKRVIKF